ncbi:hypothetical protein [Amycolatopsis sp. FDAARGOS 1241]|uniref:hypothetical protein n=1 Tax=Amycolatopsis sp. FDAARGOS 1241 TaxID=2778070 RepID=UPI001EF1D6D7
MLAMLATDAGEDLPGDTLTVHTPTYTKVFRAAREATFTPQVARGPLARRPYDLRHAAVSTWLAAGVPAATVAQWAGQSVGVLLEVYASFLDGGEEAAKRKIDEVLGNAPR